MLRKFRRLRVRKPKTTLRCEALEDRRVLATFTVNALGDTADANPGDGVAADAAGMTTLRAALEEANAFAGADDIDFSTTGTITLSLGELVASESVSIDGANGIVVDAAGLSRVMSITAGTSTLANIVLTNGSAARGGGLNTAAGTNVTLSSTTVQNSSAVDFGGGIFSEGTLTLNQSLVTGNSAGAGAATAYGGGIVSYQGDLVVDNSTVSNNTSTQYGGGIFALQGSALITNNSLVTGNLVNNIANAYSSGAGVSGAAATYASYAGPVGVAPVNVTINGGSTISNNTLYATNFGYGSALYSFGYGTLTVEDATISGNSNTGSGGARGGAGFNWPAAIAPGTLTINISDTVIDGNYSAEESAAFGFRGVTPARAVELTITGVTISNNSTAAGAGAAGFLWSGGGGDPLSASVTVVDSIVTGNSAGATGGGLEINNAHGTITDTTIDDNYALTSGGGLYTGGAGLDTTGFYPPSVTLTRTTISNNYATLNGGGAYAYDSNLILDNSTISGNSSLVTAGGVRKATVGTYVGTMYETFVDLYNSTVTNNYAPDGGGLYGDLSSTFRANSSIVAGNSAGINPDISATGIAPIFEYSMVGDNTGSMLAAANPDANGNKIGDGVAPIDPMLGALANNGGNTLTHLPMPGSPAIDMGDPAVLGGIDQTLGNRVKDGRVDMGSVETGMPPVDCDFDDDNDCDLDDIDALTMTVAAGSNDPNFDISGDGVLVNGADITAWLIEAGGRPEHAAATGGNAFYRGDFDLSGQVNGADFVIWNTNKFPMPPVAGVHDRWSNGDGNGDGTVDGPDFIIWNTNKFCESIDPVGTCGGTPPPNITSGGFASTTALDRALAQQSLGKRVFLEKVGRFPTSPNLTTGTDETVIVPREIDFTEPLRAQASDKLQTTDATVEQGQSVALQTPQLKGSEDWRDRESDSGEKAGNLNELAIDSAFARF